MKVLANDGISAVGVEILEKEGFEVITTNVPQNGLIDYINRNQITVILVRSATKVRKETIDACPSIKIIGRGGVGMDNIDVEYGRSKGISVINTPKASSEAVAELVLAHLFTGIRFLHDSNRKMPLDGDTKFSVLKKHYAKGKELKGRTIGIIGFGRIGIEVAKKAIALGMKILAYDKFIEKNTLEIAFFDGRSLTYEIKTIPLDELLANSDFITLHAPHQKECIIGQKEIKKMKDGTMLINASRGGLVDEEALINALDSEKVSFAGLDVFENEPTPKTKLLMHPRVSLTPHIGAATEEAQKRIGSELAYRIIDILKP